MLKKLGLYGAFWGGCDDQEEELAVMCASHWGEPFHLSAVRSILVKIGCTEADLACGGHSPAERCAYDYVRAGAATPFVQDVYNK